MAMSSGWNKLCYQSWVGDILCEKIVGKHRRDIQTRHEQCLRHNGKRPVKTQEESFRGNTEIKALALITGLEVAFREHQPIHKKASTLSIQFKA